MAYSLQNLSEHDPSELPDASETRIGIVCSDWNKSITHSLLEACRETLLESGVNPEELHIMHVPGTFELPTAARLLAMEKKLDAIICLGCVIKGETDHDVYINTAVSQGLVNLSLALNGLPVIFGVLTPNNEQQALDRAGGKHGNKGVEAATTALKMAALYRKVTRQGKGIAIRF
ncbi:MAG: 6,7-dimethyl-8-ribityllumazine synthase [Bacteroidota bacterium]